MTCVLRGGGRSLRGNHLACHSAFCCGACFCFVPLFTTLTRVGQTGVREQCASEPVSVLPSNSTVYPFSALGGLGLDSDFFLPAYKHAIVRQPSPGNFCPLSSCTVLWQAPLGSPGPLCPARRTLRASALDSLPFTPSGDLTGL